ncbi:hypothetical protein AX16_005439 [Volvariella volvacea WC 439]|nr:hypothetical protein AX16_005439 [Volvariella volvacea WC 439]
MNLPTSSFIGTNHIPNDEEVKKIKLQIINPCIKQVEGLEDSISSLKAQIRDLERERDALSLHIGRHRAHIAPIRLIPHDILREIFIRCLPTSPFVPMKTSEAPLLLGRHTSTTKAGFKKAWKTRIEGISSWLLRSGTLPLSISVYYLDVYPPGYGPPFLPELFELLFSFKHKWKRIEISSPSAYLDSLFSPGIYLDPSHFASLDSFAVCFPDGYWEGAVFPSCILKAPQLRSLVVRPI